MTIGALLTGRTRRIQGVLGLQPDEALENVRFIRHREALPCREGKSRTRAGCPAQFPPEPQQRSEGQAAGESAVARGPKPKWKARQQCSGSFSGTQREASERGSPCAPARFIHRSRQPWHPQARSQYTTPTRSVSEGHCILPDRSLADASHFRYRAVDRKRSAPDTLLN